MRFYHLQAHLSRQRGFFLQKSAEQTLRALVFSMTLRSIDLSNGYSVFSCAAGDLAVEIILVIVVVIVVIVVTSSLLRLGSLGK